MFIENNFLELIIIISYFIFSHIIISIWYGNYFWYTIILSAGKNPYCTSC
jgi:hypothetical protein